MSKKLFTRIIALVMTVFVLCGSVDAYAWQMTVNGKGHMNMILNSGIKFSKAKGITANEQKSIMLFAQRTVDTLDDLQSKSGSITRYYHGMYDYIGAYRFLNRVAVNLWNRDSRFERENPDAPQIYEDAIRAALNGAGRKPTQQEKDMADRLILALTNGSLKNAFDYNKSSYIKSYNEKVPKEYQITKSIPYDPQRVACFVYGMAVHCAADTYAHSACGLKNGKWVWTKNMGNNDDTGLVPGRNAAAHDTVKLALDNWKHITSNVYAFFGDYNCSEELYVFTPAFRYTDFKLNHFDQYARNNGASSKYISEAAKRTATAY